MKKLRWAKIWGQYGLPPRKKKFRPFPGSTKVRCVVIDMTSWVPRYEGKISWQAVEKMKGKNFLVILFDTNQVFATAVSRNGEFDINNMREEVYRLAFQPHEMSCYTHFHKLFKRPNGIRG